MEQQASADHVDPAVKRDLFFGDVAFTRRRILLSAALVIPAMLIFGFNIVRSGSSAKWPDVTLLAYALIFLSLVFSGSWRRRDDSITLTQPITRWRGLKALEELLAEASRDPDLASDQRLAEEVARARRVRLLARAILVGGIGVITMGAVALSRQGNPFAGLFCPASPPTVELVDVILTPWSADFHGAITVDVTGGHVTQIAPYDSSRSSRVEKFRAFEAIGKYLVAGGAVDLSQSGWLDRFKASWMRPIDIGTSGDFLIVDVDPRSHEITRDQIAAAVVGGKYYSRKDLQSH